MQSDFRAICPHCYEHSPLSPDLVTHRNDPTLVVVCPDCHGEYYLCEAWNYTEQQAERSPLE
jgi:hypothetical protein